MKRPTNQGIAIVAVLWVVLPLSIMAAILLSETRSEARFVRTSIAVAQAEALADAGIYRAVATLLAAAPEDRLAADGRSYLWRFGESELLLSIQDERGKIDLNVGSEHLLRGLFTSVGVAEDEAQVLVDRIRDFADPDHLARLQGAEDQDYRTAGLDSGAKDSQFASVDELYQVLGVPPGLIAAVAQALTVYSKTQGLDPRVAPREALLALPGAQAADVDAWLAGLRPQTGEIARLDDWRSEEQPALPSQRSATAEGQEPWLVPATNNGLVQSSSGGQVFTVRSEVAPVDGARFVREAVVELTGDPEQPFVFREWRRGDSPSPVEPS
ncbi:MAG TPA: hypothetical protein VLE23_07725 [Geminicoccaceae bacterium]|nr:hypothetical protein [Geminicoccaceae bacterium]